MRRALTIGTFDTPHAGHAYLFRQCEQLADEVVVGVNSDEFVEQYKGQKPLFEYAERAGIIEALGYTVVQNNSAGRECIEQVLPDILVIGSDWARKDYYAQIGVTQNWLDERRIALAYIPRAMGLSSTEIKARSAGSTPRPLPTIDREAAERAWTRHHNGI